MAGASVTLECSEGEKIPVWDMLNMEIWHMMRCLVERSFLNASTQDAVPGKSL